MKPLELFFFSSKCYSSVCFAWMAVVHFKVKFENSKNFQLGYRDLGASSHEPGWPGWLGFRDLASPLFSLQKFRCVHMRRRAGPVTEISFIHPSRVYYELTIWPAPSWLDSSVGRALHRHRRGHGFESRSSLIVFFRLSFRNCSSCVVTARIFLLFDLSSAVQIYVSYIYIQTAISRFLYNVIKESQLPVTPTVQVCFPFGFYGYSIVVYNQASPNQQIHLWLLWVERLCSRGNVI